MAVKWCDTIASVSNTAAIAASRLLNERTATLMANAPKIIPSMIEAATKSIRHTMRPGISTANIPV